MHPPLILTTPPRAYPLALLCGVGRACDCRVHLLPLGVLVGLGAEYIWRLVLLGVLRVYLCLLRKPVAVVVVHCYRET